MIETYKKIKYFDISDTLLLKIGFTFEQRSVD